MDRHDDRQRLKERDQIILEHAPLVKKVALRIISRLPRTIQLEDLISVGTLGLIDAVEKFDASRGKSFRAYAEIRIKGAILDELRQMDSLSRGFRRAANEIAEAEQELEQELGREVTDEELAARLNVDLEELHMLQGATRSVVFLDIDAKREGSDFEPDIAVPSQDVHEEYEPLKRLEEKQVRDRLAGAVEALPEKLKLVLSLYYQSELNYKEIGEVMKLSESRISQLHTKAVAKLRKTLASQEIR